MVRCVVCFILVLIVVSSAQASLIAYWALNDSSGNVALDSSVNGRNGAVGGTPDWVAGRVGGALDFDGSTDYIYVVGNGTNISGTMSVALWAKPRNLPYTSGYRNFMASDSWVVGPPASVHAHLRRTTSLVNFDTDCTTPANGGDVSSTTVLVSNQWYHIAWTYDAAIGEAKMYINGVLEATSTVAGSDVVLASPGMTIGARVATVTPTYDRYFNGIMDEIRIYNHVLSANEVAALAVPEPITLTILGLGGLTLLRIRRKA
jgi:hypothetical protein